MTEMIRPPAGQTEGLVWDAARRVAAIPGLNLERRRSRLLRTLLPHLGPAQLEHITLHCEHVARTAARLAGLMRLAAAQAERVRLIGLMHDIGKALAPDRLLGRAGPLTEDERGWLARHAAHGAGLCEVLGAPADVVESVAAHHERFDGPACPPLGARIVHVADAMVVMTTGRAYSAPRTFSAALAELRRGRGAAFDPDVVVAAHIHGASVMALAA